MQGDAVLNAASVTPNDQSRKDHRTLLPEEIFWRDHQPWLTEKGYMLRPRYRPGWVPSWTGTGKAWRKYEDGVAMRVRTKPLRLDLYTHTLHDVAPCYHRCHSSIGWRDCHTEEILSNKRP